MAVKCLFKKLRNTRSGLSVKLKNFIITKFVLVTAKVPRLSRTVTAERSKLCKSYSCKFLQNQVRAGREQHIVVLYIIPSHV